MYGSVKYSRTDLINQGGFCRWVKSMAERTGKMMWKRVRVVNEQERADGVECVLATIDCVPFWQAADMCILHTSKCPTQTHCRRPHNVIRAQYNSIYDNFHLQTLPLVTVYHTLIILPTLYVLPLYFIKYLFLLLSGCLPVHNHLMFKCLSSSSGLLNKSTSCLVYLVVQSLSVFKCLLSSTSQVSSIFSFKLLLMTIKVDVTQAQ